MNGLYGVKIGQHYKDPLKGIQLLDYLGKPDSKFIRIKIENTNKFDGTPKEYKDLLDFQKSSAYKKAIEKNGNLQTLIFENTQDPLPGQTIATRNPGIIWIKKGGKFKNNKKWKPKQ